MSSKSVCRHSGSVTPFSHLPLLILVCGNAGITAVKIHDGRKALKIFLNMLVLLAQRDFYRTFTPKH